MKTFKSTLFIVLIVFGITSCNDELITTENELANIIVNPELLTNIKKDRMATGSVEIIWKGGEKGSEMGNQPENLRAFFGFNASEGNSITGPKGEVLFRVTAQDLTIHREIRANVLAINFLDDEKRSWFVAKVFSDSKGCNGGPGGEGHESGCSGEDNTGGGCGDETSHDGGCTDGHNDGGSCTDTHTDEGGCSGSDMDGPGETGSGSTGGADNGNPLSGKNCRIGQLIIVKVRDMATPGVDGDDITWKWFAQNSSYFISNAHTEITVNDLVVHLCKKRIIDGNLVVHL